MGDSLAGAELFYLRCWVGFVGVIAVCSGVHCYVDQAYTRKRIYTLQPKEGVLEGVCLISAAT